MTYPIKYPKTQHILGSKECDIGWVPKNFQYDYPLLPADGIVVEEKMDGMGIGIFFTNGMPYVQFRNHVFKEDSCPYHFRNIFPWIPVYLEDMLGENLVIFGEWMEYKHTISYDTLPSYFIEYDIFDRNLGIFLDTPSRRKLLGGLEITSAYVYDIEPIAKSANHLKNINNSNNISNQPTYLTQLLSSKTALGKSAQAMDIYPEGFYIKREIHGEVVGRYKFIRKSFMTSIAGSEHWQQFRIKNKLAF